GLLHAFCPGEQVRLIVAGEFADPHRPTAAWSWQHHSADTVRNLLDRAALPRQIAQSREQRRVHRIVKLPDDDHVVAENQSTHQFWMMRSDPHGQHAAERMPKEHGGSGNALANQAGDVFGILRALVSAGNAGGFAMPAKVGREDLPTQAQRGNHGEKYLPAPAEAMQQHERRPMGRAFGVVQLHFARVEGALDEGGMVFTHDFTDISHWLATPYVSLPPTKVLSTFTSRIFAGSMVSTSSLSNTMSASFPAVIEPFSFS